MLFYCLLSLLYKGEEMFPSEMVILMAIAANKDSGKKLLARPMDITSEYIGYLYSSLVNRGYLKGHRSTGYQLTAIGRESILEFLHKNGTRAKDMVKRLQLLGIEISPEQEQKIDKLKKEAIMSSREAKR
jgi:predicted transcriptional regulator